MAESPRVAVLALDAMDAGLALRMAADGRLPRLAGLLERSWSRPVANPQGLLVGGVWPTYWSGSGPGHHGFYCFRQVRDGTYEVVRRTPADISVDPLWSVLSRAGRRCAVIDAPMTTIDPQINGLQTVEWGAHDRIVPFATAPESLAATIVRDFGAHPVRRCDSFTENRDLDGLREALLAGVATKQRIAERYFTSERWDLFVVGHSECHCAGHQFWGTHDPSYPRHDPDLRRRLGDPIVDVYRGVDDALGRHLDAFGEDTTVFVILSHGIGPHYDGDHLLPEILFRLDDALQPRPLATQLRERALRRLHRSGLKRRGAVALDGSRRFYRVPNNELYGGIRINLLGREPRGRVAPGPELDALVADLRRELLALTNPDTGRPIVADVLRTSELHPGPALTALPDLLVDWARALPINGATSPTIGTIRGSYDGVRSGDHRPTGYLLVSGPGIEHSVGEAAVQSIDVAPTVAALLGVAMPDAQGEPVAELVHAQR